jgi:uncharacterized SAM-binding protein YcdF (DUF218 family)
MSVFFLIKRLEFLLLPFTWVLLMLGWAWFTANPYLRRRLLGAALGFLLFFSNSVIVDECYRWWETEVTLIQDIDPNIRTAILLGGGLTYDKTVDRVNYGSNADRYIQVLEPYHSGRIKRIVVVGGDANYLEPWTREGDMLKRFLLNAGVKEEHIILENQSRNTYDNALKCKPLLDKLGEQRYLLVTSSTHIRRAVACFEAQGIAIQPYAVQKRVGIRRWELDYLLVPQVSNLNAWASLIHEWIGYVSYKVRGYC